MKGTAWAKSEGSAPPVQRSVSSSSVSTSASPSSQLSPHLSSTADALKMGALRAAVATETCVKADDLATMEMQSDHAKALTEQALIGLANISSCAIPLPECVLTRNMGQSWTKMQPDSSGESSQDADSNNSTRNFHPQVANQSQPICEHSNITSALSTPNVYNKVYATTKQQQPLRRGKWTSEEEDYVARAIHDFNNGYLNALTGTTLRTFLSEKLNCDPMRITKKFTGDACIGKRVFHPAVRCETNTEEIVNAQTELDILENKWRKRIEAQQKDSSRRSHRCASSLEAWSVPQVEIKAAKVLGHHPANQQTLDEEVVAQAATRLDHADILLSSRIDAAKVLGHHPAHQQTLEEEVVAQTATWLDHADILLSNCHPSDVENQMKQVEKLIHEGPLIRKSATLSKLMHSCEASNVLNHQPAPGGYLTEDNQNNLKFSTLTEMVESKIQEESLPSKRKVSNEQP